MTKSPGQRLAPSGNQYLLGQKPPKKETPEKKMHKDESRVQSLLSAFTRKRAAPPKVVPEVKPETPKSAYTPAMRAAVAGITGAAFDLARTSIYNRAAGTAYQLSASQRVIGALKTGAGAAGAVSTFSSTEGKPMAARIALSAGALLAAPAALKALEVATNSDLDGKRKSRGYDLERRQITTHKSHFGSADSRPYL